MNRSNGAVRTLMYRARKILKEKIEDGSFIDESNSTVKEIKKAINKKLVQVGVISALSAICFLLCLKFVVSPIMNKIYYNPLEKVDGYSSRMDIVQFLIKINSKRIMDFISIYL